MLGRNAPNAIVTEGLPAGYTVAAHKGRKQPFTLWCDRAGVAEVVSFHDRRKAAFAAAAADSKRPDPVPV